jgi:hypothetical protein
VNGLVRLTWLLPFALAWLQADDELLVQPRRTFDLEGLAWHSPRFDDPGGPELLMALRGDRWLYEFDVDQAGTARLELDWTPGPTGMLVELLLAGQRLGPPRDAWRPTPRRVLADLGSRWLGPGRHLLEIVCREQSPGLVVVHELVVRPPRIAPEPDAGR